MLQWPAVKSVFDDKDSFFNKIDTANLDIGRKNLANEQKLSFIKTLMPADVPTFVAEESAKKIDPAFEVLFNFLNAAIEYRTSMLKQIQGEYLARKKKAEEEEQPFEEPDLTTV